jgi:hypothetical protein
LLFWPGALANTAMKKLSRTGTEYLFPHQDAMAGDLYRLFVRIAVVMSFAVIILCIGNYFIPLF